jgi:hypothetical protein
MTAVIVRTAAIKTLAGVLTASSHSLRDDRVATVAGREKYLEFESTADAPPARADDIQTTGQFNVRENRMKRDAMKHGPTMQAVTGLRWHAKDPLHRGCGMQHRRAHLHSGHSRRDPQAVAAAVPRGGG